MADGDFSDIKRVSGFENGGSTIRMKEHSNLAPSWVSRSVSSERKSKENGSRQIFKRVFSQTLVRARIDGHCSSRSGGNDSGVCMKSGSSGEIASSLVAASRGNYRPAPLREGLHKLPSL